MSKDNYCVSDSVCNKRGKSIKKIRILRLLIDMVSALKKVPILGTAISSFLKLRFYTIDELIAFPLRKIFELLFSLLLTFLSISSFPFFLVLGLNSHLRFEDNDGAWS